MSNFEAAPSAEVRSEYRHATYNTSTIALTYGITE